MSDLEDIKKPLEGLIEDIADDLYWSRDLGEAEKKLLLRLEDGYNGVAGDGYSVWGDRYCRSMTGIRRLIMLDGEMGLAEDPLSYEVYAIRGLVEKGLLFVCTRAWRNTKPRERSFILAPLLIAAYSLSRALSGWPSSVDYEMLNYSLHMAYVGFSRAKKLGILGDLNLYIEESVLALMRGGS